MRKRIAYSKLGRSVLLHPKKWGAVGGDNEPLYLLLTLAARHPDVDWVVAGRHSKETVDLPPNVLVPELPSGKGTENEWRDACAKLYADADGAVIWMGQHGTSNFPIPQDADPTKLTNPQEWSQRYAGPIIKGVNAAGPPEDGGYEPAWLCADPRNYLKARDLKDYPLQPVLGQFNWGRAQRHYRYDDTRIPEQLSQARAAVSEPSSWGSDRLRLDGTPPSNFWLSEHSYMYSGLELTGVPQWERETVPSFAERQSFGIIINEARPYVNPAKARAPIMRDWVMPLEPSFVYGKWTKEGATTIGLPDVQSLHYTKLSETLSSVKSTFTTPSSGSEWATAKPWEAFALGTICFFHPFYDTQGHIVPTLEQVATQEYDQVVSTLTGWLRPRHRDELAARVKAVNESKETYEWLAWAQREVLRRARERDLCLNLIDQRLGLRKFS